MGIYIEKMELPKGGNETIIRILPNGEILDQYGHHLGVSALSVPPHGRLGDLDEIERYKERLVVDADKIKKGIRYVVDTKYIKEAPTIIPAEEVKEL